MSAAIKVENLSKAYQLGEIGTGTISRDIERWWALKRGKEDPFLKVGETNDRTAKGTSDVVWSLKDISFEIEQGDAVGIIGRNGAGKSTLLKILSRVTSPTSGKIKLKGRVASLLEVGTGFHPELTGKENIFLNGAILGMRRKEIQKKFDEIVAFAGVERYIDTPVKRYSSGMYVRLAFAVAAHLDSEILIVDEVLAVGDAEFQKKCLGKMGEVSKGEGRTVLFVSHNMTAVTSLCNSAIMLEQGNISKSGDVSSVISRYMSANKNNATLFYEGNGIIKKAKLSSENKILKYGSCLKIEITLVTRQSIKNLVIGIVFKDEFENGIVGINNRHYRTDKLNNDDVNAGQLLITIPELKLLPGNYRVDLYLGDTTRDIEKVENALSFHIEDIPITATATPLDYRINKIFHKDVYWEFNNQNQKNEFSKLI